MSETFTQELKFGPWLVGTFLESVTLKIRRAIVGSPLGSLSLGTNTFFSGSTSNGSILNATATSTITASGLPTGLTINGAARTWAWDGTGSVSSGSFTLTETLAPYTPVNTILTYNIIAAATAFSYDSRYGTATDVNGWITFGLRPTVCRHIWCNSNGGFSDANDGLTAATAKATAVAARTLWLGAGFTAGDQLMLAEGGIYNDDGLANLDGKSGFSATYPTAILSYNPAAPADATQYGRAIGTAKPKLNLPTAGTGTTNMLSSATDNTLNFFAVQGIEVVSTLNESGLGALYVGKHDHIVWQNFRLNCCNIAWSNAAMTSGRSVGGHISKFSVWGAWANGGSSSGVYVDGTDGFRREDYVVGHNGWRINSHRDDLPANGGAISLGHGIYFHATNINGINNRGLFFDNALDGKNTRGSCIETIQVSINEPHAGYVTHVSGAFTEAPTGSVVTVTDMFAWGGIFGPNSATPVGHGPEMRNAAAGTAITNFLGIYHGAYGSVNNYGMLADCSNSGIVGTTNVPLDKITLYQYCATLQIISGSFPMTLTWTNSNTDELPVGGSGNSVSSAGQFPNLKTTAQLLTVLNFASMTDLYNMALHTPHLQWAPAVLKAGFDAFGKTMTYAAVTPPVTTGFTPPAIYSSDVTAPTLSSPSAPSPGSTTATLNVTTNEATGWLYWVVTTSATPPTAYQVGQALNDTGAAAVAGTRQAVSATGVQTVNVTGLTASTTYYAYLLHQDGVGNRSTVAATASFTTTAGVVNLLDNATPTLEPGTTSYNAGTHTLTVTVGGDFADWVGIVSPNTTYTFTANYTMSSGSKIRIADNSSSEIVWTSPVLSASGTINITFTTSSSSDRVWFQADTANFSGTLSNMVVHA